MLPQKRHGITSRARSPYPRTFSHLDMILNPTRNSQRSFGKTIARLGLISLCAGLLCAIILYTNHWFIDIPFSTWNPIKWILTSAWLVGWLLGTTHFQNNFGALLGATVASGVL